MAPKAIPVKQQQQQGITANAPGRLKTMFNYMKIDVCLSKEKLYLRRLFFFCRSSDTESIGYQYPKAIDSDFREAVVFADATRCRLDFDESTLRDDCKSESSLWKFRNTGIGCTCRLTTTVYIRIFQNQHMYRSI